MTVSSQNAQDIWQQYQTLKTHSPAKYARDLAHDLAISEAELTFARVGHDAVRLNDDARAILSALETVGETKCICRNDYAVHEQLGSFTNLKIGEHAGLVLNPRALDLRLFITQWASAFALREQSPHGERQSIQFFDRQGDALLKVYATANTVRSAWDDLLATFTATASLPLNLKPEEKPHYATDSDAATLDRAWRAMTDVHQFFGLLKKNNITRQQAFRLVGDDLACLVSNEALPQLLDTVVAQGNEIMIFVGNRGCTQIFTGALEKALLVGSSLALCGCVLQGLFRNPLADPSLLGVSGGAALAVAMWLVLPFSVPAIIALYAPMVAAFVGSLSVMVVIFMLSQSEDGTLSRLLLVGIAINALCAAAVGMLSWISNDAQLRQLSLWGMGTIGQAQWSMLLVAATLMVPSSLVVWRMAAQLNLLQLGDEEAHYLGVNVPKLQRLMLLCSALLVASSVAICGIIGFIGLVVPHLMRLWLGADHRALVPGSLLMGALLLLVADTVARTLVAPAEMPVGLITSIIGAPWFLWMIFKQGKAAHG